MTAARRVAPATGERARRHATLHLTLLLTLSLGGLGACAKARPEIDQASVTRILTTLSADEMQGRRAFTPAATKAAEFINDEFEAIGLDHFDGLTDYLEDFPVYRVTVDSAAVTLNGRRIPEDQLALFVSGPLHWTGDSGVRVLSVGPEANPMETLGRVIFEGEGRTLVLLDPAHEELFRRLQRFAQRGTQALEPSSGANTVVILTREDRALAYAADVAATVSETGRLANVVGVIPGRRPDELVLFTAHYDHIGIVQGVDGDSIANGANDDASGTTAVIELARYFKALGRPERTLVFVAFAAEEIGGFGSRYFAGQVDPDSVVAMFNIEMIGKPAAEGPHRAWITGFDKSDFGRILAAAVPDSVFTFYADPYPGQGLFERSDNAVFARLGVPAHSISTTPIDTDRDYHHVSDEIGTLDLPHVTATIQAIAEAAEPIVSGTATPTRIALPAPQ